VCPNKEISPPYITLCDVIDDRILVLIGRNFKFRSNGFNFIWREPNCSRSLDSRSVNDGTPLSFRCELRVHAMSHADATFRNSFVRWRRVMDFHSNINFCI
jgi:hypothetical protein